MLEKLVRKTKRTEFKEPSVMLSQKWDMRRHIQAGLSKRLIQMSLDPLHRAESQLPNQLLGATHKVQILELDVNKSRTIVPNLAVLNLSQALLLHVTHLYQSQTMELHVTDLHQSQTLVLHLARDSGHEFLTK